MLLRDLGWLEDILIAARKVTRATAGVTREQFESDEYRVLAVERLLMIIGEAAKQVSAELKNEHPDVPWRHMAGMRDMLIHSYRKIDSDEVWKAAAVSAPALIAALEPLIPQNPDDESSSDDA